MGRDSATSRVAPLPGGRSWGGDGLLPAALAAMLLLTSCGSAEAETEDDSEPAEGQPSSEVEAADGETEDSDEETEEDPEPVPASSEGPAENWPEPDIPEEIYEETEEGVEAALEYWLESRAFARNTGDTAPLLAVSYDECAFCTQQVERVQETYEEDGWYVQEVDQIDEVFVRLEEAGQATALFTLNQGAFDTYWEHELLSRTDEQVGMGWSGAFIFESEKWSVARLEFVGDGAGDDDT